MALFSRLGFKQKLLLTLSLSIFPIILFFIFNYWLMMRLSGLASQIQINRIKILTKSQLIDNQSSLKINLEKAREEMNFLDNILPPAEKLIDFPREIAFWANQNQLQINFGFGGQTPGKDNEPGFVSFTIRATGSTPQQIINFIRTIETSRYFIRLNLYNITKEADNRYGATLDGQIFSR